MRRRIAVKPRRRARQRKLERASTRFWDRIAFVFDELLELGDLAELERGGVLLPGAEQRWAALQAAVVAARDDARRLRKLEDELECRRLHGSHLEGAP